jgi:mRNA interferase MazF
MLPDAGDIAWVDFDPVKGTEQAGRRPALILTSSGYHQRSRRSVVCPITSAESVWAFNVLLPPGLKTRGSVMVDQVRVVERADRMFGIIETAPEQLLSDVRGRLAALLGFDVVMSGAQPQS